MGNSGEYKVQIRRRTPKRNKKVIRIKITKILHYGLRRSATFYVEKLIESNVKHVNFINDTRNEESPRHKHYVPEASNFKEFEGQLDKKADVYLIICKHPLAWYVSYQSRRSEGETDEEIQAKWNKFYGTWLDYTRGTNKICIIDYFDLLIHPERFIKVFTKRFKLTKKPEFFNPVSVEQSDEFTDARKNYYLNGEFLIHINVPLQDFNYDLYMDVEVTSNANFYE